MGVRSFLLVLSQGSPWMDHPFLSPQELELHMLVQSRRVFFLPHIYSFIGIKQVTHVGKKRFLHTRSMHGKNKPSSCPFDKYILTTLLAVCQKYFFRFRQKYQLTTEGFALLQEDRDC